jgi:polysaccharide biosynthesis/export protein
MPVTIPVRVAEDGTANIPLVGPVPVAGLELPQAERAIAGTAQVRQVFVRPHITVTMKEARMNRVLVLGAVEKPGSYDLPRNSSTLLAALVSAGGLKEEAGPEVEIRHADCLTAPSPTPPTLAGGPAVQQASFTPPPGGRVTLVNLATAATQGGNASRVDDGDVVLVHKRDVKPVYVIGLVTKPGAYELPTNQDLHVLEALAMAGERTTQMADKVFVIRRVEGREQPLVVEVSVNDAKRDGRENLLLQPGDVISVEETPVTAMVDAFKNFFRIGFNSAIPLF